MNKDRMMPVVSGTARALLFAGVAFAAAGAMLRTTDARAQVLAMTSLRDAGSIGREAFPDRSVSEEPGVTADVPARLRRQIVHYSTSEAPGTIVVDTPNAYLYFVLGGATAIRYGIGVGRDGFTWSGAKTIERKSEWPDWLPPAEMLARQPYLPRFMAGGPGNPLGARAMYLSGTVYRIHGTNNPSSIGKHVSSGCIRMLNEDVVDLYRRTPIGTKVVVLPMNHRQIAQTSPTPAPTRGAIFAPSLR